MADEGADRERDAAEGLAIDALAFIAGDHTWLGRFLAATGIGPATLRRAAADPAFLRGVLDFLLGNEPLLVAFAGHAGIAPERIGTARRSLAARRDERGGDGRSRPGAR